MPAKRKTILFVSTADTDILAADRALADLPKGFARVAAYNPVFVTSQESQKAVLASASTAGVVLLRLLGGKQAMPDLFDPLVNLCRARGVPLIACPGHEEWDQDLVAACSVPPAEVDTVFSYLMRGGIQNMANLFLFLSDSYLGTDYGHDAPAPLPWEGVYHPDLAADIVNGGPADADAYVKDISSPELHPWGCFFTGPIG